MNPKERKTRGDDRVTKGLRAEGVISRAGLMTSILLLGGLMVLGAVRGELAEIRLNAVTLCLSCLGLGR